MPTRRAGYTLFEVMLVMAVLIVAAAISVPVIDAMLAGPRITAARDMIQGRWADMRGRAMQEGRPYRFSVIHNTGKFKIEPDMANDGGVASPMIFEGELPEGILFCKSEDALSADAGAPGAGYETILVYLPDGTARDDVSLCFGLLKERATTLNLRALTGAVTSPEAQP